MQSDKQGNLGKLALGGAGAMMAIVGALHLIAPQMMMEAPALSLESASHHHVIRAAYGGAYLGIAALFFRGLTSPANRGFSLMSVVILFSGFAFGRLVSIAVDGVPVALYLGVLAFELTFVLLALIALRQVPGSTT